MTKPIDLMIVGAPKTGTTSLHHYLQQHPKIHSHLQPEMVFFVNDNEFLLGFETAYKRYFGELPLVINEFLLSMFY